MRYPNLKGCSKQKWTANVKSLRNPTDINQLAYLWVEVSKPPYIIIIIDYEIKYIKLPTYTLMF